MNLDFYINGIKVREPQEYRSIELELNFEDSDEIATALSAEKFTWLRNEAKIINNYLTGSADGTNLGIYYGLPLVVKVNNNILFNGYIDLTEDAEFSCDKVITKVREAKKIDWLDRVADGISFDFLASLPAGAKGRILESDFIKVPYIVSDIPDYKGAALFILAAYVITRDIIQTIRDIANVVALIGGYLSVIAGVIQLIILVAYLIILIIALIKLIKQIVNELIQPIKYHLGMKVEDHFKRGCEYFGLTFSSSIFQTTTASNNELLPGTWKNLVILPEKNKEGFKKNAKTEQLGFYNGTFGDFVRAMMEVFNAKFTILGSTFHFERRDFGTSTQIYKIPDIKKQFYGINADELVSNYLIQFLVDPVDLNTINRYKGTNVKNFTFSKNKDASKTELISGFKQPNIPFALGRRKNTLTTVEKLVEGFLKVVDKILAPIYKAINAVIKVVNKAIDAMNKIIKALNSIGIKIPKMKNVNINISPPSNAGAISKRIGMLSLTNDMFSVPKLILIEGSGWDVKIPTNAETALSAIELWKKYHYLESFVPTNKRPSANQAHIWEMQTIPFCLEDYYKIRGLNNQNEGEGKILSPEGRPAKILSLKWNIWKNTASIKYKEEKVFAKNLNEKLIENKGE